MKRFVVLLVVVSLLVPVVAYGMGMNLNRKAIVVCAFGTSYPDKPALGAILNVYNRIRGAYQGVRVDLAFTSLIIRNIWHKRAMDKLFKKEHPEVPAGMYSIKSPLAALACLSDQGFKTIAVQPLQVTPGEEYDDLKNTIAKLREIHTLQRRFKPFYTIALGRPLLGEPGIYKDGKTYHEDLEMAAKALEKDVKLARKNRAALVYMGHGNEHMSTALYLELQAVMRKLYKTNRIYIGTVEGFPRIQDVVALLKKDGVKKVIMKPLMVVAGDHARNDMAGNDRDSWKMIVKRAGITVKPIIEGIGANNKIADVYLSHLKDAQKWVGIKF